MKGLSYKCSWKPCGFVSDPVSVQVREFYEPPPKGWISCFLSDGTELHFHSYDCAASHFDEGSVRLADADEEDDDEECFHVWIQLPAKMNQRVVERCDRCGDERYKCEPNTHQWVVTFDESSHMDVRTCQVCGKVE